ncbi:MAG: PorT family protein [Culturomica sp.]|jgi:hypothetical protein|nr:PorT family protein [Culturomica sp.]
MKKIILLSAVCFCCFSVFGQLPVNFGIHGGVSNTKLKVDRGSTATIDYLKSSAKTGYMIGLFGRVNLGPVYVEPSLNYSHRESETKINNLGDAGSGRVKYNSFDIPVMLGFHVVDISLAKVRVFAGPVASFTGKLKIDDLGAFKANNDEMMWSGKVGLGVDVWKLTFDVDYEKAFKKFQDNVKGPSALNFTLGFKIIS